MKMMRSAKTKLISLFLVLSLILSLGILPGCFTITGGTLEETSPVTPEVTEVLPPTPINPLWTPPATEEPAPVPSATLPNIADVVALVKPSVVAITTEVVGQSIFGSFIQEGAGSGWILDEDGIIVTNNHVVEGARAITVTMDDGSIYTADPASVATDPLNDLAILKIDATGLPALKRGDTESLRVGDWVVAIGNALGQGIRATEGIISRKGVNIPVTQDQTLYDLLETSAAINPGNSGGPLVNLAGEVIGINSAKIATVGVEGMGYAISMDTALPIVQELVTRGYVLRPWLGVALYTVDQMAIAQLDLKVDTGVLLARVGENTPASRAGLQAGDVITSIGGEEVTSVQELTRVLYSSKIGSPLDFVVWRGDQKLTFTVTPIESPTP